MTPRRLSLLLLTLVAGLGLSATFPLRAADFYVSEKGSDTAPGTSPEQAFLTLQRADSAVKPGDTVHVMNGTYRNATVLTGGGRNSILTINTSGTPDAWITWRAHAGHQPELVARGCWMAIDIQANYIVLDGLTLTGNNDHVRQIDAEENALIDPVATLEAWKKENAAKAGIDESVSPELATVKKPNQHPAMPVARPKPVQKHSPNPAFNSSGVNVDCRKGPLFHHFILRNLVVRKFGTVGISMIDTDYYTIENCQVYDNAWYGRYGSSGISMLGGRAFDEKPGYHNVIRNNKVWNNKCLIRTLNIDIYTDGNGIIIDSLGDYAGDILIENNLCYNNGGAGIHAFKVKNAAVDVFNNTMWRNQQLWLLYEMGGHTVKKARFLNNIVYTDRAREVTSKAEAGVLIDHNLYFGSYKAVTVGPNDRLADPLFVMPSTSPEFADFRLQPGSPAIDSGVAVETMAKTDLAGHPRRQGAAPDRGAYEAGGAKP